MLYCASCYSTRIRAAASCQRSKVGEIVREIRVERGQIAPPAKRGLPGLPFQRWRNGLGAARVVLVTAVDGVHTGRGRTRPAPHPESRPALRNGRVLLPERVLQAFLP